MGGCSMLAAIANAMDGNWKEAAELTKAHPTLEMQALCVMFCLCCNQASMAEKMLQEMQGSNDDSATFRLANAAVKLATGDPEEAYLTYCDLSTQFPPVEGEDTETGSVLLQTGKALANMQRGMFSEAVEDLMRGLAAAPHQAGAGVPHAPVRREDPEHQGRLRALQGLAAGLSPIAGDHVLDSPCHDISFCRWS